MGGSPGMPAGLVWGPWDGVWLLFPTPAATALSGQVSSGRVHTWATPTQHPARGAYTVCSQAQGNPDNSCSARPSGCCRAPCWTHRLLPPLHSPPRPCPISFHPAPAAVRMALESPASKLEPPVVQPQAGPDSKACTSSWAKATSFSVDLHG